MTPKCMCGGKHERSDIVPVVIDGRVGFMDTDPKVAHWKCNRCGRTRTQRKRQKGGIIGRRYVSNPSSKPLPAGRMEASLHVTILKWIEYHNVPADNRDTLAKNMTTAAFAIYEGSTNKED